MARVKFVPPGEDSGPEASGDEDDGAPGPSRHHQPSSQAQNNTQGIQGPARSQQMMPHGARQSFQAPASSLIPQVGIPASHLATAVTGMLLQGGPPTYFMPV